MGPLLKSPIGFFITLFLLISVIMSVFFLPHTWKRLFNLRSHASYTNQVLLGNDLTLSLDTDLPDGLNDIKFFVMKKNSSTTRSQKFGFSGVQGEWDLLRSLVVLYNNHNNWGPTPLALEEKNFPAIDALGSKMLERHFAMISALGVSWIRMDMSWERVEASSGVFDFTKFDQVFDAAKRNNLKVLASLMYTPGWMYSQCPYFKSNPTMSSPQRLTPTDLVAGGYSNRYNTFVQKMVERYKPHGTKDPTSNYGITNWQIWNEEDYGSWVDCTTGYRADFKTYASFLQSAYQKIHDTDSSAKVLMGGFTHLHPADSLKDLYANLGSDKKFDILDMHFYVGPDGTTLPDLTTRLTAFANERNNNHGDSEKAKEIWLTETSINYNPLNPTYQTTYMKDAFGQVEKLNDYRKVTKAFWWGSRGYFFDEAHADTDWTRKNAMIDTNFYPRQVYFDFGEWLGTITNKGAFSAAPVKDKKISVTIPRSALNEAGDYVVFYASPSKIVTALPLSVQVTLPPHTWTFKTQAVCPNNSIPTKPTRVFWALWPPNPLVWNYQPLLTSSSTETQHITTITAPGSLEPRAGYIGLADASLGSNWDTKGLVPVSTSPLVTSMSPSTYFNPLTWMMKWQQNTLPVGTYTINFRAPDSWCSTPTIANQTSPSEVTWGKLINNTCQPLESLSVVSNCSFKKDNLWVFPYTPGDPSTSGIKNCSSDPKKKCYYCKNYKKVIYHQPNITDGCGITRPSTDMYECADQVEACQLPKSTK